MRGASAVLLCWASSCSFSPLELELDEQHGAGRESAGGDGKLDGRYGDDDYGGDTSRAGDRAPAPGDDVATPGDDMVTPGDDVVTPGDDVVTPGDDVAWPTDAMAAPTDAMAAPTDAMPAAADAMAAPTDAMPVPGEGTFWPADSMLTPGDARGSCSPNLEPNDSMTNPHPIYDDGQFDGAFCPDSDTEWFRVAFSSLTVTYLATNGSPFYIIPPTDCVSATPVVSCEPFVSSMQTAGGPPDSCAFQSSGQHCFQVVDENSGAPPNEYTLSVRTFGSCPASSAGQDAANPIALPFDAGGAVGIVCPGRHQWFRTAERMGGSVTLDLSWASTGWPQRLAVRHGTTLLSTDCGAATAVSVSCTLALTPMLAPIIVEVYPIEQLPPATGTHSYGMNLRATYTP